VSPECLPTLNLLAGIHFLLYSSRSNSQRGNDNAALTVVTKLNLAGVGAQPDDSYLFQFRQTQEQIQHEKENTAKNLSLIIPTKSARKRLLLAVLVQVVVVVYFIHAIVGDQRDKRRCEFSSSPPTALSALTVFVVTDCRTSFENTP